MSSSLAEKQQLALTVAPKISGGFSAIFSAFIVYIILKNKENRRTTYHRLLFGISCVDIVKSVADFIGTWPMPRDSGALWAVGNAMTCNVQGFFTSMGVISPMYNASLSIYYLLLVRYRWNDERMKKIEPWLHAVPLAWGASAAIAALSLDILGPAGVWCWISPEYNMFRFLFTFGPLWVMVPIITINCILVVSEIVRLEKDTAMHISGTSVDNDSVPEASNTRCSALTTGTRSDSMAYKRSRKIALQCLLYAGSFYLTWTCISVHRIMQAVTGEAPPFALTFVAIFLVPAAGFPNFLVYLGPKCIGCAKRTASTDANYDENKKITEEKPNRRDASLPNGNKETDEDVNGKKPKIRVDSFEEFLQTSDEELAAMRRAFFDNDNDVSFVDNEPPM